MSTAVIAPVNPMSAEGKDTVMSVMRRDRANFIRVVSDPKNWEVQTRCTEWETRDLVGHMIDVLEGYMKTVSYTHLRAHETRHDLVCRLLLEKKKKNKHYI